jgi:K+-transporting ATPase c subunit
MLVLLSLARGVGLPLLITAIAQLPGLKGSANGSLIKANGLVVVSCCPRPAHPAVPADAVTGSGSGLDQDISIDYAKIQEALVAKTRGVSPVQVAALVARHRQPHSRLRGRAYGQRARVEPCPRPSISVPLGLAMDEVGSSVAAAKGA